MLDGVLVHRRVARVPGGLPVHPRPGRAVRRLIERRLIEGGAMPFDVAHVHVGVVSPFAQLALPALARAGVPMVVTVHSMWGPAAPALRALARAWRLAERPVVLSAVSPAAAEALRPLGGGHGREVLVLPNGIDPARWRPRQRTQGEQAPAGEVVVAAVQRLARRKRPMALLEIVARARRRLPAGIDLRLVVAGDGPLRGPVQRRASRPDLAGRVDLAGRLAPDGVRGLLARAELFLTAGVLESFGIAALEARCAGVPVLARRGTGVDGFVTDGAHGRLAADDDGLVRALAGLAADPAQRRALAIRSLAEPPGPTWPVVLEQCADAYRRAMDISR